MMMGGMVANGWTYGFVFLVICTVCLVEYYQLLIAHGKRPKFWYGVSLGLIFYILSFLVVQGIISAHYYLILYPLFTFLFILKLYDSEEESPFENIGLTLLGIVYTVVPFVALHIAVFVNQVYN